MTSLESVEKAVAQLSPAELAQFRQWFAEFDSDVWDAQIEADAAAGKLDALAEEALAEYYSRFAYNGVGRERLRPISIQETSP